MSHVTRVRKYRAAIAAARTRALVADSRVSLQQAIAVVALADAELADERAKVARAWDEGYAMASDDFTHSDYCGTKCQCDGIHGQSNPYRAALEGPA